VIFPGPAHIVWNGLIEDTVLNVESLTLGEITRVVAEYARLELHDSAAWIEDPVRRDVIAVEIAVVESH
jgi:hypothetical protein